MAGTCECHLRVTEHHSQWCASRTDADIRKTPCVVTRNTSFVRCFMEQRPIVVRIAGDEHGVVCNLSAVTVVDGHAGWVEGKARVCQAQGVDIRLPANGNQQSIEVFLADVSIAVGHTNNHFVSITTRFELSER